jgi:hypothetical protein
MPSKSDKSPFHQQPLLTSRQFSPGTWLSDQKPRQSPAAKLKIKVKYKESRFLSLFWALVAYFCQICSRLWPLELTDNQNKLCLKNNALYAFTSDKKISNYTIKPLDRDLYCGKN